MEMSIEADALREVNALGNHEHNQIASRAPCIDCPLGSFKLHVGNYVIIKTRSLFVFMVLEGEGLMQWPPRLESPDTAQRSCSKTHEACICLRMSDLSRSSCKPPGSNYAYFTFTGLSIPNLFPKDAFLDVKVRWNVYSLRTSQRELNVNTRNLEEDWDYNQAIGHVILSTRFYPCHHSSSAWDCDPGPQYFYSGIIVKVILGPSKHLSEYTCVF